MLKHARASEGWDDKNIGQKGFTLIELLVVIIILGILAAVVVLAVNGLQDQGENNACDTERKAIEAAAAAFFADEDEFPTTEEELTNPDPPYIRDNAYSWTIDPDSGAVTGVDSLGGADDPEPPTDPEDCGID
jgi:prepilin-type N-terminal cleavage/methylation domain-containing protein